MRAKRSSLGYRFLRPVPLALALLSAELSAQGSFVVKYGPTPACADSAARGKTAKDALQQGASTELYDAIRTSGFDLGLHYRLFRADESPSTVDSIRASMDTSEARREAASQYSRLWSLFYSNEFLETVFAAVSDTLGFPRHRWIDRIPFHCGDDTDVVLFASDWSLEYVPKDLPQDVRSRVVQLDRRLEKDFVYRWSFDGVIGLTQDMSLSPGAINILLVVHLQKQPASARAWIPVPADDLGARRDLQRWLGEFVLEIATNEAIARGISVEPGRRRP